MKNALGEPSEGFPKGFGRVHHVLLSNLVPDTQYEYKIHGENPGVESTIYTFRTTKTDEDGSRFLVIGDMQDEQANQRWQDVADSIVREHMDDFDFIIAIGDLAKDDTEFNGDRFYWWKVFFDKGKELFLESRCLPL